MTGKQDILICIGAAIGANCIPCFEHLYEKALEQGVTPEEIKNAVDLGERSKKEPVWQ
ncbi:MAG: carboxymuconolactone decarboxylase family protein [Proteobacteria bacterium]|nr:carboxymuconolactone decarboxylase family protein [Pseudomonadota bacterium]